MSCNLIYKNGKLEEVRADNGSPSILFQRAKQIFGEETAKEIFYVSKSDQFQEVFKATIEVYKQKLLNKFNNLNEVQFSILGEKGAQNLDQTEETTFRMDNLLVAKEMEQADKTPLEIRLATGWEKGADLLWRYEILDDNFISDKLLLKNLKNNKPIKLKSVFNKKSWDTLQKAYPIINNVTLRFTQGSGGKFMEIFNTQEISVGTETHVSEMKGVILHELQHFIQKNEGFSEGGSIRTVVKYLEDIIVNEINTLYNTQLNIQDIEGYLNEKFDIESIYELTNIDVADSFKAPKTLNIIGVLKSQQLSLNEVKYIDEKLLFPLYKRLGGEVEARNVQTRMNMTAEQRRNTLLQETEDVSREDQIFLRENLGTSMSLNSPLRGTSALKAEKEVIDRLKQNGLANNVFEMNTQEIESKAKEFSKKDVKETINGFVHLPTKNIYINSDVATNETYLHEYNHLLSSWYKENRFEAYKRGLDLVKQELNKENSEIKDIIDYVRTVQLELKGDALLEEILTEVIAKKSNELIESKRTDSPIIEWLSELWRELKNVLGLSDMTTQDVANLTLGQYADAVGVDLLKGNNLKIEQKTQEYLTRITKIKEQDPDNYWSVDIPSEDVVKDAVQNDRLVEVEGGMGIVTQDGNMIGLFKDNPNAKNVAKELQQMRVEKGGIKMDNFDGYLTKIYQKNGFRVVSRLPFNEEFAPDGWNEEKHGKPDVVFMIYDPQNNLNFEEKTFTEEQYDEALAYRESLIEEAKKFHPFYSEKLSENKTGKTQAFFSDVVEGKSDKYKAKKEWTPLLTYTKLEEAFNKVYSKFKGNFDNHIATSIPTFRETQVKVGSALVEMLPNNSLVYDIGGSEGGFVKAITEVSEGKIKSINLDVNESMQKAHETSPVEGSEFVNEAFYESYTDEDTGKTYKKHVPKQKADVVHESMVFQFITPERKAFIKEVKNKYLKSEGILLLEEKLVPKTDEQWLVNERKKDSYKLNFYTQEEISGKAEEVLLGMRENQTQEEDLIQALKEEFAFVEEYWDAGNFKGYIATNSKEKGEQFLDKLGGKITSEFSSDNSIKFSKSPKLEIQKQETKKGLSFVPTINGQKAGAIRLSPHKDGYKVDEVVVYDRFKGKGLGTRLYQEVAKDLVPQGKSLYSLNTRTQGADNIWQKFVNLSIAEKIGNDYKLSSLPKTIDKNGEPKLEEVTKFITNQNKTDRKLNTEEKAELLNFMISNGYTNFEDLKTAVKQAFYNDMGMFTINPQKLVSSGLYDKASANSLTDEVQPLIEALLNTDMEVNLSAVDYEKVFDKTLFGNFRSVPRLKENVGNTDVLDENLQPKQNNNTREKLLVASKVVEPTISLRKIGVIFKTSEAVAKNNIEDVQEVLDEIVKDLAQYGIDLVGLDTIGNYRGFLEVLREFITNPNQENINIFSEAYNERFMQDVSTQKVETPTDKKYFYSETKKSEQEVFEEQSLIKQAPNLYYKVRRESIDSLLNKLNLTSQRAELEKEARTQEGFTNPEIALEVLLYKKAFKTPTVANYATTEQAQVDNFSGDYQYLTTDFVADFQAEMIKEKLKDSKKYKNFYSLFDINEKGLYLKDNDSYSLALVEMYADNNLRQYSLLSKQLPNLKVTETDLIPQERNNIVNNKQQLKEYKGNAYRIDNNNIIVKGATEKFIKIDNQVFESVQKDGELSLFSKIIEQPSEYYQIVEQPLPNLDIRNYSNLKTTPEKFLKVSSLKSKVEIDKLKNNNFDCI